MVKKQQRLKRRVFTPEFRAEAVRLGKVATAPSAGLQGLDLMENSLREWVKRADVDAGERPPDAHASGARGARPAATRG